MPAILAGTSGPSRLSGCPEPDGASPEDGPSPPDDVPEPCASAPPHSAARALQPLRLPLKKRMGRALFRGPSPGRFSPLSGAVSILSRCCRDSSPIGAPRLRGTAKGVAILLSPPPSRKTRTSERTLGPIPFLCGTSASHRRGSYRVWRAYRSSWSPGWGSSSPASRGT